jgi:hypothetical protein
MANESAQDYRESSRATGKFVFLFVFLLVDIAMYTYSGRSTIAPWYRALNILILVSSVYAVSFRRLTWIVALVIAVPVGLHLIPHGYEIPLAPSKLQLAGIALSVALDTFIIVVIFKRVFQTREVTTDAIYGAVSIYLLAGFAFARSYGILVALEPGAFYLDPLLNHHTVATLSDLTYYSFVTMTSLGAVGISPASDRARSISVVESVLGILYLGVLVSRLIAAYRPSDNSDARP